nr:MAG TPA: hypothetical protein [Caudoviricetes sp.]DAS92625.1 MAG TPA: hypothetical protein [Caudoviricetes sp.]DAT94297.1 MAG TPA: hypothetical protein [Caudoviricetes sp.]
MPRMIKVRIWAATQCSDSLLVLFMKNQHLSLNQPWFKDTRYSGCGK